MTQNKPDGPQSGKLLQNIQTHKEGERGRDG